MQKTIQLLVLFLVPLLLGSTLMAEEAAEAAVSTLNAGDTAWMITATVLVLFMTLPGLALPCLFVRVCACMTLGDKTNGERGERNGGGREMSVPRYRGATVSRNSLLLHTHACIMLGDHGPHLRIHFIQVLPDQACHIGLDDSQPCQIAQYVCLSVSLSIHHEYIHPSIHPVTIAFMHAYLHTYLEHGLCLKNGRVLQAGD